MSADDQHDKEAGRQLAWVLAVVSVLAVGGAVWLGSTDRGDMPAWMICVPIVLVVLTVGAFLRPVIVVRLVSGQFDKLLGMWADSGAPGKQLANEIRPVATSLQEGTPLELVAAEDIVKSVAGRRRLGKLMMLGALVALGLVVVFWGRMPETLAAAPVFLFVGGLVIWYRTL